MNDSTGSIHPRSAIIFEQVSTGKVIDTFDMIATATELQQGRAVKITDDGEVGPLAAVTDKPIGLVSVGEKAGCKVGVMYFADARVQGFNNTGGTLSQGDLVRQVIPQAITDGERFDYAVAASTEYAIGEVLCDSADQTVVKVKIFDEPQLIA